MHYISLYICEIIIIYFKRLGLNRFSFEFLLIELLLLTHLLAGLTILLGPHLYTTLPMPMSLGQDELSDLQHTTGTLSGLQNTSSASSSKTLSRGCIYRSLPLRSRRYVYDFFCAPWTVFLNPSFTTWLLSLNNAFNFLFPCQPAAVIVFCSLRTQEDILKRNSKHSKKSGMLSYMGNTCYGLGFCWALLGSVEVYDNQLHTLNDCFMPG